MTVFDTRERSLGRRVLPFLAVGTLAIGLSGCATAVIGSITVGQISAAVGVASVSTTGKGLQDHALSVVTGQDCRLVEGIFRRNRRICEEPGSPATENDFPGVVVLLFGDGENDAPQEHQSEPEVIYAGLSSDYRPALTRGTRRRGAIEVAPALPIQMASFQSPSPSPSRDDRPMLRPVETIAAPAEPEMAMPIVLDADFALLRTERQTGEEEAPIALAEANEVPTVYEWAQAQPAPTIPTVRLASFGN